MPLLKNKKKTKNTTPLKVKTIKYLQYLAEYNIIVKKII